jgi:hypothetical protein
MILFFVCKECDLEFKAKPSDSPKFCSRKCWSNYNLKKRSFTCTHCNKQYEVKKEAKKPKGKPFCKKECWDAYQIGENNPAWKGIKEYRDCVQCNNKFLIRTSERKKISRFCSFSCRTIFYKNNGHPSDHNLKASCGYCGIEIKITKRRLNKRTYCNYSCSRKAHSAYIRGNKNGRYVHGKTNSAYPAGWTNSYKETIRNRDSLQCKLCNLPQKKHDVRLHVHHIDYNKENLNQSNLITLCKYCHGKMHGILEERTRWKEKLSNLLNES